MTCNIPLGSGTLSFLCHLPSGHDGPHAAQGNDRSLRQRAEWEQAQVDLRSTQGKAQTTSERNSTGGETGTPPPGFFPCRYHQVIHHQDVRSEKCMAWSGAHDGPQPRTIQRLPQTMGSMTSFEPLPDMPGEQRPAMVYDAQGSVVTPRVDLDTPDPRVVAGEQITVEGDFEIQRAEPVLADEVRSSQDQYDKSHDRPEDQPMPVPNDRPTAHAILMAFIQARLDLGIQRYGTGLQPFNGRDSARDSIEEGVDLLVYLITFQEEKKELRALLDELRPMVGMSPRGNEIIDRLASFFEGQSA